MEDFILSPEPRGSFNALIPVKLQPPTSPSLPPNNITMKVNAVGLNFRDVLNVLGMYPGDPGPPGSDCAGVVIAAGSHATHAVGDLVFGQASGCLGTMVGVDGRAVVPVPVGVSQEAAATLPTVFLTALACLDHAAKVQAGQKVLVHAASGKSLYLYRICPIHAFFSEYEYHNNLGKRAKWFLRFLIPCRWFGSGCSANCECPRRHCYCNSWKFHQTRFPPRLCLSNRF